MAKAAVRRCNFEMSVKDVFFFQDGSTVFVGIVTKGPELIPACAAELLVSGKSIARFVLTGETLPLNKTEKHLRAVATTAKLEIGRAVCSRGACQLRGV
jgi:hypothetical protein